MLPLRTGIGFLSAFSRLFQMRYVADPDFVEVDTLTLTSKAYTSHRARELFKVRGARHALQVPVTPGDLPTTRGESHSRGHGTSHLTVMDRHGNAVALTTTVNHIMGSRVTVPGRGYLLNNEMCDFDALGVDADGRSLALDRCREQRLKEDLELD